MSASAARTFLEQDPILASLLEKYPLPETFKGSFDAFAGLCSIVIGQQVSVRSSVAVEKRVLNHLGSFTPEKMLETPEDVLGKLGMTRNKIRTLKGMAVRVKEGLDLDALQHEPDAKVSEILLGMWGIGQWSTDMFLMFGLGHEDVFPWGDVALRRGFFRVMGQDATPGIAERWRPFRSYASWLFWQESETDLSIQPLFWVHV
ncbi:DNA-3-methyladenine glycosylase family protein [Deinococcus cellulosilyticus]|uniref:DNA-3-methyladenine glycosylase II n=1 Tax=Deinococcus cellulosilyticus (strain DSM 18568 / NBRC 106333 / KACC 11606 / 5516J-15) TaxID=1223518 RepID=A0A511N0K6_DEIC1|nr:DNA-3-methyladenine glycosylase [Deinococcus cellulosilyticus]GEM45978.1 DNA-3-methyladenine glycosidase [Deinococcus cellulosilyticus NBRC 106333 = KACC 11606]